MPFGRGGSLGNADADSVSAWSGPGSLYSGPVLSQGSQDVRLRFTESGLLGRTAENRKAPEEWRTMAAQPDKAPAAIWRKSRASADQGACVEVAYQGSSVWVRDSLDISGPVLTLTLAQWSGLLSSIRNQTEGHG